MDEKFLNLKTIAEKIAYLKNNGLELPNIEKYNSEWDESRHRIMIDLYNYPDRIIDDEYTDAEGVTQQTKRIQKLNRVPLAYQKKIVNIAVAFLFGNPVKYTNNLEETDFYEAFQAVLDKEKIVFTDREIAKANGRFTQCAELWWTSEEPNQYYGFPSNFRLKVNLLTPDKNKMYPYFNDQGDMVAFFREYEKRESGQKVKWFELYTAERIAILKEGKSDYEVISDTVNPIGKIPIVWYQFEEVEWKAAQPAIERKEEIASDEGEVNKKFSAPILALTGEVTGSFSKDKSGKVLQLTGEGSSATFVQPPNASESLKNEDNKLERIIHEMTNTPNISFENLSGMGNMLATEQADFVFMSAHLKVTEKMATYVPALKRRASIIKSFLQLMNVGFRGKDLDIEPVITPYIINNDAAFYRTLMEINGNQPLISQKESMERAGIKDSEAMMSEIQAEKELANADEVI